jgi:hypothetical protein
MVSILHLLGQPSKIKIVEIINMKLKFLNASFVILTLWFSGLANAGIISSDEYQLEEIGGSWTYGYTGWNASSEYGNFGNALSEYSTINNILSDGYEYSCRTNYCSNTNYQNGYNSVYNWGASGSDFLTFAFDSSITLTSIDIITSRMYGVVSFDYFDGSTWNTLVASLGSNIGNIGCCTDSPSALLLSGQGYTASFSSTQMTKLRMNTTSENTSIHELTLHGETTSVPEPSTLAIFAFGMIGLASRRFKKQS